MCTKGEGSMKTVREIAEITGVSRQAVHKEIHRQQVYTTKGQPGQPLTLPDDVADSIIKAILERRQSIGQLSNTSTNTGRQNRLTAELDAKNRQIEELLKQHAALIAQVETLTKALESATETARTAQALHAGTMKQVIEEHAPDAIDKQTGRKWWQRVLGTFLH